LSDDAEIIVFDAHGKLLTTFGRAGDGPGEFSVTPSVPTISSVYVGNGDTVFVFHAPFVSVFSPALKYVRTIHLAPGTTLGSVAPLADGSWMIGAHFRVGAANARSIHVMQPDGTILRSLGSEDPVVPGRPPTGQHMFMVSPDQQSLWVAKAYSLEQWRVSDNAPLSRFGIYDVPWLNGPAGVVEERGPRGSYQLLVGAASVLLVGVDTLGQLWMGGQVPMPIQPGRVRELSDWTLYLEIVDPKTRSVRSSQRLDMGRRLSVKGDFAMSGSTDADGIVTVTTWTYRFVNR
jgi:hypothetical protein